MKRREQYITKQGRAILAYIESLHGEHITVEQIAAHFYQQGESIGLATIYRHLDKLISDGKVRKYVIDGVSSACYQYVEETCHEHFHLKCEICGELQHLECESLKEISRHIFEHHNFLVNPMKTVFYGKCDKCSKDK